jgi:Fe2+ transport system protein B
MTPNPGHDGGNAYQLGRMAEALHQNTVTLAKLVESVDENSRNTVRLSNRQDRMEQVLEQLQADQRKMVNIGMTGQSNEQEARKLLAWVNQKYQEEQTSSSSWITRKNAVYISIMVAMFWFMFALVKDAAVAEVATQLRNQTEIRNKG